MAAAPAPPKPRYFRNPDGSLFEGRTKGYKPEPPRARAPGLQELGSQLSDEFEYVYFSHERFFVALLLCSLIAEVIFNFFYISYRTFAVHELGKIYREIPTHTLWTVFWSVIAVELFYCATYYLLGIQALLQRQLLWFKVLILMLRLGGYMYARFLGKLLESASLLPNA